MGYLPQNRKVKSSGNFFSDCIVAQRKGYYVIKLATKNLIAKYFLIFHKLRNLRLVKKANSGLLRKPSFTEELSGPEDFFL